MTGGQGMPKPAKIAVICMKLIKIFKLPILPRYFANFTKKAPPIRTKMTARMMKVGSWKFLQGRHFPLSLYQPKGWGYQKTKRVNWRAERYQAWEPPSK